MTTENTPVQTVVNLPIPRIPQANKATIIELLWVDIWTYEPPDTSGNMVKSVGLLATTSDRTISGDFGTDAVRGNTIFMFYSRMLPQGTFAQGYSVVHDLAPHRVDLQDRNGRGFLIAADNIYVSTTTGNFSAGELGHTTARFFYRFVEVSTQEYVGIIQAQTSGS